MTTDTFGNNVPFVALPSKGADGKALDNVPNTEVGKGPKIKNEQGAELQLDVMFVQRGDERGRKYFGCEVTESNLMTVIDFFGMKYIASRLNTSLNTENQKYCFEWIKALGGKEPTEAQLAELHKTLAERDARGETKTKLNKELQAVAIEMSKHAAGTPEHMAAMLKLGEIALKLANA